MAKAARFNQGYDITENRDGKLVRFRGDGVSWAAYVILPLVALFVWNLHSDLWFVQMAVFIGMSGFLYVAFETQSFTLTPTGIEKGGKLYDYARIGEVQVDNPMDKSMPVTSGIGVIAGGSGIAGAGAMAVGLVAGAAGAATLAANQALARSSAKRRFRVRIRYGSKMVTLGRNLKQEKAAALFDLLTRE